jgi:hypothetical protein
MELPVVADNEVDGDQLYVLAPEETSVVVIPVVIEIDAGLTVTVGAGLIVNGAFPPVFEQPFASVTIRVPLYVPLGALVGTFTIRGEDDKV